MVEYGNFLERNVDGTHNATSPLAQIYLLYKANNESYTWKKILQQLDRDKFFNTMEKEVLVGVILKNGVDSETRKEHWNYISVIYMLNYLVNRTHPGISHEYIIKGTSKIRIRSATKIFQPSPPSRQVRLMSSLPPKIQVSCQVRLIKAKCTRCTKSASV